MSARTRAFASFFVLLLVLPGLPLGGAAAHATEPVAVEGPAADGTYSLTFDVIRAVAGAGALALDVAIVPDDAPDTTTRATRTLGTFDLPAGVSRHTVSFLPVEGSGDYSVALRADDRSGAPLHFRVERADGASADVAFTIPDEPTRLALTGDSVNGDLKLKSPGDAVVTRATLEDGNGRADVERLVARIEQLLENAWMPFEETTLSLDAAGNATVVPIEHRYARSPIPAATYRLTLVAQRESIDLANASRTFVIREVAPTLVAGALPANVTPDANVTVTTDILIGDKNGFSSGQIEARIYRGSTRVEAQGFRVALGGAGNVTTLADGQPQPDAEGQARVLVPLALHVPALASAGAHRVSLYVDGVLLGSLPFDVAPLPRLQDVRATAGATTLRLNVSGTGDGWILARVADAEGEAAVKQVAFVNGAATLELDAPSAAASLRWSVALHARLDGPALDTREAYWNRTTDSPVFVVVPERVGARLPATWRLESPGWDVARANATVGVFRWDGAAEPALSGQLDGDRVIVRGPPTVAPGRYEVRATLTFPNGTAATLSWTFETGPWMRVAVGAVRIEGREARIEVENVGGVALPRFLVESGGVPALDGATYSWLTSAGATRPLDAHGARRLANGVDLAPGGKGTLVVRLPDGPLPSGELRGQVRLLALAGGA